MSQGINNIARVVPGLLERTGASKPGAEAADESSFSDTLGQFVKSVDSLQKDSARMQEALLNGEPVELHQVMIKAEEAGIAMDLLLEIRNRLVNGFDTIMKMPM
jgi:flagellar hook-basal body complex protein FliE